MTFLEDATPQDLGLPPKFTEFRKVQIEGAKFALYGPTGDPRDNRRFHCMGIPPGGGKSGLAHMIGVLGARRYALLTATRSLEDQQVADGFDCVNVRGRSNYPCVSDDAPDLPLDELLKDWSCEKGEKNKCEYHGKPSCTYGSRVEWARTYHAVLSNYQWWMNVRSRNRAALTDDEGNPIDLLIGDEAHLIPNELSRFLSTWISIGTFRKFAKDPFETALSASKGAEWGKAGDKWRDVIVAALAAVHVALGQIAERYPEGTPVKFIRMAHEGYRQVDDLRSKLEHIIRHLNGNNWIWRHDGQGITFDCIWPAQYAESSLWTGVERIVLMSATLRPKTLGISGVAQDARWFKEWPRIFPPHKSPVYWVPTGRMGMKAGEEGKEKSVARLDEMIAAWDGRRGIVHTPSYPLAEWMYAHSRYARRMVLAERGKSVESANRYRKTAGGVLIGPSFMVGWDFADEACEWQFIPKLPYPDRSDPVTVARCEDDETYYSTETMQKLVQACGRGTRHEEDECVTVIGDDSVRGFRHYAREAAPKWFKVIERKDIPHPKN